MDIFAKFEHIVSQHQPTQIHFLVGFSGGLDSTALLSLLTKFCRKRPHFSLSAIHTHHGLSPNADHWVTHCQHLCRQLSVPLIVEKVQVDRRLGVEAGAREARYQAIRRYMRADHILTTAHHQQDQTETFFSRTKTWQRRARLVRYADAKCGLFCTDFSPTAPIHAYRTGRIC
ncbi:tRNA lysidine(34) synthetase TilS [Glaesserella parasuis]|uniref:tRNA lysidine(34) synthetase TilS n=1 Tax=Glaesserella parasuis TaxID=738 RepID=UPI003B66EE80